MRRAALALLLLAGCSAGETAGDQRPPPAVVDEEPPDPHGELACDAATLAGIDETIAGQLDALAAGDYAAALGFSSERFRAATTPERFRTIVETDYPLLLDAGGHRSGTCVARGDDAQVLVTVEGAGGATGELLYTMTREGGQWRVDLAGFASRPATPEPVEV